MSIKPLETEFTLNADKSGDNVFRQVKRSDLAAIYSREKTGFKPHEWEVFQIRKAGGVKIFERYYDPYEQYPGASAFGKTAWSVNSLERAEQIYESLNKGIKPCYMEVEIESVEPGKPSTPGKPAKVRKIKARVMRQKISNFPPVKWPKGEWSMKQIAAINAAPWTKPRLYTLIQGFLEAGAVKEMARRSTPGQRGRATVFYSKVK
jgi:hypothetical protein